MSKLSIYAACMTGIFGMLVSSCEKAPVENANNEPKKAPDVVKPEYKVEDYFLAVRKDNVPELKKMISAGMELDARDSEGRTALHIAATYGALKSMKYLIGNGIDVDVTDHKNRTPLMEAVQSSTPEMVRYLIDEGADLERRDDESYGPLMIAVREGRDELIPDFAGHLRGDFNDALMVASILGHSEVIDALIKYGASMYTRLEDGRTPLMLAAGKGNDAAVDMLLTHGANPYALTTEGKTAADLARSGDHALLATRLDGGFRRSDLKFIEPYELTPELFESLNLELDGSKEILSLNGAGLGPSTLYEIAIGSEGLEDGSIPMPPIVMRAYLQKELPMIIGSIEDGKAKVLLVDKEGELVEEGDKIEASRLSVESIHPVGNDNEASLPYVLLSDEISDLTRKAIVGVPVLSGKPLALVEDWTTGNYYMVRRGQHFTTRDAREFVIDDVLPNHIITIDVETAKKAKIPLQGPQG